ncbi:MAG: PAS domain S-box protein [Thermoanaerobaculia bacterium]
MQRPPSVTRFARRFRPSTPGEIAMAYAAAGFLWVALSDFFTAQLPQSIGSAIQTVQGFLFIAFTAIVIYVLLLRRRVVLTEDLDALAAQAALSEDLARSLEEVKAAQTALAQSETRLRHLFNASLDVIITVATDDLVLEWNEAAERLFGWSRAEAIGEKLADLIVPGGQLGRYRTALERLSSAGEGASRFETMSINRMGEEFPVEVTAAAVEWGERIVVTVFLRDISDRVRAAQEAQLIQAVVNAAPFAIIGLEETGRILSWNPAAEEMYGWNSDAVRSTSASILFPPDSEGFAPLLDRIRLGGEVQAEQDVHGRADGKTITVVWSLAPLPTVDGLRRAALIAADRSEQQHLERRLSDAEYLASLGRLAGTVAHEFNNVLMGIQSFAEVIGRRPSQDEGVERAVAQIKLSVQRGRRITEDVLRFTRAAAAPALSTINVDEWLGAIATEIQELVAPRVSVHIERRAPGLHVVGDQGQLYQVITNLAINANDAMPEGGEIRIAARGCAAPAGWPVRDACAEITVSDTGSGMSPETAAHAFEPLFTTKKRGGTGLGLSVVQKIIRAHGGEVSFETGEGKGTKFCIRLPARYENVRRSAPPVDSRSFQPRRILLVEDDATVAAGLADLLRSYDMTVDVLHSGLAVVEAVKRFSPDILVLDVGLPDRDGIAVFGDVADAYPRLPVLFSTGHADEARLEGALSRSHVRFLRKPYPVETLLDQIEQLTEG